jgi:hypothetical protein
LLVDGRLARISRSSEPVGRLAWNGVFPGGRRVPHGPLRVALAGVDLAGNRSTASRAIDVKFG